MTNFKSTKRALFFSVIALFVCIIMLLGATYAWFTDSATSPDNQITAGKLDVELYKWTSETVSTNVSEDKAAVFPNKLWEPGKTEVVYLSVKNAGTLNLKYKIDLIVTSITTDNLADVIEYNLVEAKYGDITAWAGNGRTLTNTPGANATGIEDVELAPEAEHFYAISIHMLETAGNEYMNETIKFDIDVLAGQDTVEEDAFGNDQYDADAIYPDSTTEIYTEIVTVEEGAAACSAEIRNEDDYKVASVTVPAAAIAPGVKELAIKVEPTTVDNANIVIPTGSEAVAFDVSVGGLVENNTELIMVTLRIPAGLDPASVVAYHYAEAITSSYNPSTGYVTIQTASFSPFTVVYNAESEYEAPVVDANTAKPTATVTYEEKYVNTELPWGNYGQWSPAEGLEANLEAAFKFACPAELDPAFANWYCDFVVSLDKALGANQIFLGGNYGSFGWVGFHNGDVTLNAGDEIGLLESVTTNPWTYADVYNYVKEFTCGVGDVKDALEGATFTVKLRLTNPDNANESYDVNVVTHTFGGNSVIDGTTVVTTAEQLAEAFENADDNTEIQLGGDIDLNDLNNLMNGN